MAKKHLSTLKAETPATPATISEMPLFSADALGKLTERIQSRIDDAERSKKGANKTFGKQRAAANSGNRDRGGWDTTAPINEDPKKVQKLFKEPERQKANPTEIPNVSRAKERACDADISKAAGTEKRNPIPPQPSNTTKDGLPRKPGGKGGIDQERLLKEPIELGGTHKVLDLVDGIDSDEDEEEVFFTQPSKLGKRFQKELLGFLKELGLEAGKLSAVEDG